MAAEFLARRRGFAVLIAAMAVLFWAAGAVAQTATTGEDDNESIAVLTADKVYIRSGAANSYYPFGMLREGALVKVLEEKYNWARVATTGPAFEDMFGYIKQSRAENRVLRLNSDGTKGMTLGRVNLVAANLETGNSPQHSWKPIAHLEPDTEVVVLKTIESESQIVYAVALPESASGWVSMAHLREATSEERKQWTKLMEGPAEDARAEAKRATTPTAKPQTPPVRNETLAREEPAEIARPTTPPADNAVAKTDNEKQPTPAQPAEPQTKQPVRKEVTNQPTTDRPVEVARDTQSQRETTTPVAPQSSEKPKTQPKSQARTPRTPTERLATLESAFQRLREEPIETAEVGLLHDLYVDLQNDAGNEKQVSLYAKARAEQLRIWGELQTKRRELKALRSQIDVAGEDVQAVKYSLQTSGSYTAVGRIATSTVYDGTQLPRLYRVQDPGTGRTIAYIRPQEKLDLVGMLDQLVGVIGKKSYDGSLRLHIIEPERIDLLAPQPEQVNSIGASAGG